MKDFNTPIKEANKPFKKMTADHGSPDPNMVYLFITPFPNKMFSALPNRQTTYA